MKLFISPPFGNWLELPNTVSVIGSYTVDKRSGLILQIFKTLRYSYSYSGWINKIGLRNKGIDHGIEKYNKNKILSVAILEKEDIQKLLDKIPEHCNLELNISCPNLEKNPIKEDLQKFIENREWCILKLSHLVTQDEIDKYYHLGFRQFHISNTFPTKEGGVSGSFLMKRNLKTITDLRKNHPDTIIIGGGGIRSLKDAEKYLNAGANHLSISTLLFNPIDFCIFYFQINKLLIH